MEIVQVQPSFRLVWLVSENYKPFKIWRFFKYLKWLPFTTVNANLLINWLDGRCCAQENFASKESRLCRTVLVVDVDLQNPGVSLTALDHSRHRTPGPYCKWWMSWQAVPTWRLGRIKSFPAVPLIHVGPCYHLMCLHEYCTRFRAHNSLPEWVSLLTS